MERAIIGAPAFRRLLRFVPLLVLLSVCQTAVYAQLSDEAVLEYALEGRRNGKSEHQIGRELLARGVTAEQGSTKRARAAKSALRTAVSRVSNGNGSSPPRNGSPRGVWTW